MSTFIQCETEHLGYAGNVDLGECTIIFTDHSFKLFRADSVSVAHVLSVLSHLLVWVPTGEGSDHKNPGNCGRRRYRASGVPICPASTLQEKEMSAKQFSTDIRDCEIYPETFLSE